MKQKLLSILALLLTAATGAWAETITWDDTNVFKRQNQGVFITQDNMQGSAVTSTSASATYEGITISCDKSDGSHLMLCASYGPQAGRLILQGASGDSFTFTAPTGKIFTKIEINGLVSTFTPYGDWTQPSDMQIAWSGTAANAVTLGSVNTLLPQVTSIVFYVEEPLPLTLSEATDNSTALSTANGKVCDVTLTRTLQTGGWNTFCVPFSTATPTGWTVKELTASDFNSSTGALSLTFGNAASIVAGTPYLVKVTSNVVNPTFDGVTISKTAVPFTSTNVDFIPTLGATTIEGSDPKSVLLMTSGNTLKSPSALPANIKGFRAYFQLKGDAVNAASFNLDLGEGETTSISEELRVKYEEFAPAAAAYDLQGRRVAQPKKGVYIQNGKKLIIK